jgi:aminoglycoside phosphotransferase
VNVDSAGPPPGPGAVGRIASVLVDSVDFAELVVDAGLDAGGRGTAATEPEYRFDAERTITAFAATLARLHHTEIRPDTLRRRAELVVTPADLIARADAADHQVGPAYRHIGRERLVSILRDGAASIEPDPAALVLSHGAPTLDRLRFVDRDAIGFTDWSHAGLADPYLDLAVAARDVAQRFGPAPIQAFIGEYGLELADPVRLDWYLLAAELGTPASS